MTPKHKKASYFFSKGLFSNISSFTELEKRIATIPEIERGDAFEVFAEAYLKTQPLHQVEEIWPEKILPQSLRDILNIPSDAGIDGVFKTFSGSYKAYQVKFRSNRESLSWGSDGLGNFFGQSDRVSERVLFTNSVDLSHLASTRVGFYSIRGSELDNLSVEDFKTIEEWLNTGVMVREKLIPKDHQVQAINAIMKELGVVDRTTAIMACGTGKTLVALKVTERIKAKTILVLLPSLALIRQTLHDWARNHDWQNFNFLCVCSDDTVVKGEDETVLYQQDLDFAVTTQSQDVTNFIINQNLDTKIIFSTYQSCHTVAQALPKNFTFDFAVFDEAHKTASRSATNHAFALQNKNIAIKKRLFLTATPRHYNIDKKDKSGDQKIVFSMDDEATYGRVSYKLSFRNAVEQNLICDYKVIISVITSDELNRELLKRGEVLVKGDIIKAQRIANIFAIQKAVVQYGINRIFSFHSSVSAAKSFTAKTNEGIGNYLTNFSTMHVNGEMSASKRESILNEFRSKEKALISNARCLTEGVNVPAVDMVAFVSPKKSKVDIAQAAGRAMRKNESKTCGYILIPLFIQIAENEDLEQALNKTHFDTVWNVLQAMQEQDENLVEIIAKLREDRGKVLGLNDNKLKEQVEILGPELLLSDLRQAITTNIIDHLGLSWDERFGELVRFKEEHGHCEVPRYYRSNQKLGAWVSTQREAYEKKLLMPKRYKKLASLGFNWCLKNSWEERFSELTDFKKEYGHCDVPYNYVNKNLASWVANQRVSHKKEKLALEKFKVLDGLGFKWDSLKPSWEENFYELIDFKEKNGHCNAPYALPVGAWAGRQRKLYKQGTLTSDRYKKLNNIGFDWDPIASEWENKFMELVAFKKENGHCNVSKEKEATKKLGTWVGVQRKMKKSGTLTSDRYEKLNSLGFTWDVKKSVWDQRFSELVQFKEEYGHCNIPCSYPANKQLGSWVPDQRKIYKKGKLSSKKYKKLNDLGFVWDRNHSSWEKMFEELVNFKKKNGHCNVSTYYKASKRLVMWVSEQRHLYKTGGNKLFLDRIDKLNAIGFIWNANAIERLWEKRFSELISFKKKNGHFKVPKNYIENPVLSRWVQTQRYLFNTKNKRLAPERLNQLKKIGFFEKL